MNAVFEDEESTRAKLEGQIKKLEERIAALKNAKDGGDREPECVQWNLYEEFIEKDPVNFIKTHMDRQLSTIESFKRTKIKELQNVLRFFTGANLMIKKAKLLTFLRRAPGYKTCNLKLLEQRLYLTRKWLKENNFTIAMEEFPTLIK